MKLKATTKMKEKKNIYTFPNYFSISVYLSDLSERMSNIAKLNMQMDRFKDDFNQNGNIFVFIPLTLK